MMKRTSSRFVAGVINRSRYKNQTEPGDAELNKDDEGSDPSESPMVGLWQKELQRLLQLYPVLVSMAGRDEYSDERFEKVLGCAEAISFLCTQLEAAGYGVEPEIERLGGDRN
jgi:hypothetical protein